MGGTVQLRLDRRVLDCGLVLHAHRIAIIAKYGTREEGKLEPEKIADDSLTHPTIDQTDLHARAIQHN